MNMSYRSVWYYKKSKWAFQHRHIRLGCFFLKKLVRVSPGKAIFLIAESTLKVLFPLRLRSSFSFWYKKMFRVTPPFYRKVKVYGLNEDPRAKKVVVTLTSYPKRIETVYKAINTLLTQTYKPDVVVLWLAAEQFPQKEKELPERLLGLRKYGLTIGWCNDIRSYKKLIPSLRKYPDALLVTADDDIYYPPDWLDKLVKAHGIYPECVVCHGAHRIRFDENGRMAPYRKWRFHIFNSRPSFDVFVTCGAGALYAPGVLHEDVANEELFRKLCPFADDIWFWSMAVLKGSPLKVVNGYVKKISPIYEADNSSALSTLNMMEGNRNDMQIQNLVSHYPSLIQKIKAECP